MTMWSRYGNANTEFVHDDRMCWLTNDFCPLCLKQRAADAMEGHHCIWSSDGGTDDFRNVLKVCQTCHAIATRGCIEDRVLLNEAALMHQLSYFGIDFFLFDGGKKKRHKNKSFLETHPIFGTVATTVWGTLGYGRRVSANATLMNSSAVRYLDLVTHGGIEPFVLSSNGVMTADQERATCDAIAEIIRKYAANKIKEAIIAKMAADSQVSRSCRFVLDAETALDAIKSPATVRKAPTILRSSEVKELMRQGWGRHRLAMRFGVARATMHRVMIRIERGETHPMPFPGKFGRPPSVVVLDDDATPTTGDSPQSLAVDSAPDPCHDLPVKEKTHAHVQA